MATTCLPRGHHVFGPPFLPLCHDGEVAAARPAGVSEREADVLAALGAGMSNARIAGSLHISVRTVEGHVSALLRKCGVVDRRALAALAGTTSPAAPPGHIAGLPRARTTLVGRAAERDAVLAALDHDRHVTLVGPGGVGKTRLAAVVAEAAAAAFPFGGAFVDLLPVRDGLLPQAVAAALGVTERAQQSLEGAIAERLGRGRSLLILDNCEHLLDDAAGIIERLLAACPATAVLATSRERLGVPGERAFPVAPLALGSDAERLFHDRACAADHAFVPDPQTVADLCARLDGLPLAIELAAARSASLGATGLLTGLGDHLRLLAGGRGAVVRHRSLRGVIGWSYDLLDDEEQAAFRRLAVFVGGFDLRAVAAVATGDDLAVAADLLGRLVDKSLVIHRPGGAEATSWRLLETIRAYASEQLDRAGERAQLDRHHLNWAAATAAELESRLGGRWRDDFDAVADDLRAALPAASAGPGAVQHRLARSLARLTFARRFLTESLMGYQLAAAHAPDPGAAADDLRSAAACARVVNDSGRAFELELDAAGRARAAGDGNAVAVALARAVEMACRFSVTFRSEVPHERLQTLLEDARRAGDPRDPVVAAGLACAAAWSATPEKLTPSPDLAEAAVVAARANGDPVLLIAALDAVRTAATAAGRSRNAHQITSMRLALLDRLDPDDPRAAAEIEDTLALACTDAVAAGDLPAARRAARLVMDDELLGDHPYLTASKVIPVFVLCGDLDRALGLAGSMWDGWRRAGRPPAFWMQATVHFVALAAGLSGDRDGVALWRTRATEIAGVVHPLRARQSPLAAFVDARLAIHNGDLDGAQTLADRARESVPNGRYVPFAVAAGAELAVVAGLPDAADRVAAALPAAAENDWAAACLARAAGRLHGDAEALRNSAERWVRMGARAEHACTLLLDPRLGRAQSIVNGS